VEPALRTRLAAAAVAVAREAGYTNAGTVEFLLDESGYFYFLEVNARLQVEHPVTEMVAGVDLVQWQIRIARGERLTLSADDTLIPSGHAIECRVYAEDPDLGFLPSPGRVVALRAPHGPGIRDDGWVESGSEIPIYYDSLLSKVIAWGEDRAQATARMRRALAEYEVLGVRTTVPFSQWLLARPEFVEARFHTSFLDGLLQQRAGEPFEEADSSLEEVAAMAACLVEASTSAKATAVRSTSAKATADKSTAVEATVAGSPVRDLEDAASVGRSWKARARKESLRL